MNANPTTSAGEKGALHWWLQRLTALALIPLTLWFVFAVLARIDAPQSEALAWIESPYTAAALIVYLPFAFWHAQLGLQVVIEDYVAGRARALCIRLCLAVNCIAAAFAVAAIIRILL